MKHELVELGNGDPFSHKLLDKATKKEEAKNLLKLFGSGKSFDQEDKDEIKSLFGMTRMSVSDCQLSNESLKKT